MGDKEDGDLLGELEKEYCPPLDPALFTAIVTDFDFEDPAQVQQLRETLDTLRISAWEQEDLPFDPSGTSGLSPGNGADGADGILSDRSASQQGTLPSRETDVTSLASEFSSVGVCGKGHSKQSTSEGIGHNLSGARQEDKICYLVEMFPSVDRFTIQHSLKKSDWDVDRSMDVLLNLAFFDEQPTNEDGSKVFVPKGVEGFQENPDEAVGRKKARKRKAKNKSKGKSSGLSSPVDSDSPFASQDEISVVNKWETGQKDIDFIYSQTCHVLKKETVSSTFHANGASLSATIRSLATAHAPKEGEEISTDPVLVSQVAELAQEFSSATPTILVGLLKITRSSVSAANELATAMLARPAPASPAELVQIRTTRPAVDVDFETPKRRTAESRVISSYDVTQRSSTAHFVAGVDAFSKASAAYRRGKSDRLMGGAAAYYSSVGRDHLERARREASFAAEALVDSQSTSAALDLHGVSVPDAVRIASERVSAWWESLGESKYLRSYGSAPNYQIITGVGRHSHDGTSRLGPAVGKMLARNGWKVEVGVGVLTVVGVVRSH